mgnify:CR=1 FL=1
MILFALLAGASLAFLLSLLVGAGGRWPMACPWKKPCRNGRPSISCLNSIASDQRA